MTFRNSAVVLCCDSLVIVKLKFKYVWPQSYGAFLVLDDKWQISWKFWHFRKDVQLHNNDKRLSQYIAYTEFRPNYHLGRISQLSDDFRNQIIIKTRRCSPSWTGPVHNQFHNPTWCQLIHKSKLFWFWFPSCIKKVSQKIPRKDEFGILSHFSLPQFNLGSWCAGTFEIFMNISCFILSNDIYLLALNHYLMSRSPNAARIPKF